MRQIPKGRTRPHTPKISPSPAVMSVFWPSPPSGILIWAPLLVSPGVGGKCPPTPATISPYKSFCRECPPEQIRQVAFPPAIKSTWTSPNGPSSQLQISHSAWSGSQDGKCFVIGLLVSGESGKQSVWRRQEGKQTLQGLLLGNAIQCLRRLQKWEANLILKFLRHTIYL